MPPAYEVLLLNTAIPQIQAAQSGDTYVVPRDIAINATAIISANSATDALRITQTGAGNALVVEDSANPDSTPFVVTAAGDVGIGTSSPNILGFSKALTINNATGSVASEFAIGGAVQGWVGSTVTQTQFGSYANIPVTFWTNNTERARIDSSGNLGLGVTPSVWGSGYAALQIKQTALYTTATEVELGSNHFVNSSGQFAYIGNGFATRYEQYLGAHSWHTAPNNTSGAGFAPISFTQAMTLDASGNLLVGTTSNAAITGFSGTATGQAIQGGTPVLALVDSDDTTNYVTWLGNSGGTTYLFSKHSSSPLVLGAANAERVRITSDGYFKASNNGTYVTASGDYHEFTQTNNNPSLLLRANSASMTSEVLALRADRNTTNATFYAIGYYNGGAAAFKFLVADSGDVTNTNGTYGTISDAKMKTDIVDAGSQWADIKALRFRKFKMKNDPSGLVQLGVVAQEVELTSPGLVDEHADKDAEGNDLGTNTKSVKTSVLLMKAAVALQEAMARIETLEAEVAALKGA